MRRERVGGGGGSKQEVCDRNPESFTPQLSDIVFLCRFFL